MAKPFNSNWDLGREKQLVKFQNVVKASSFFLVDLLEHPQWAQTTGYKTVFKGKMFWFTLRWTQGHFRMFPVHREMTQRASIVERSLQL